MKQKVSLAYLALIVSAIIWGIAPPVIKYTLNYLSPVSFLYYRFLIVSVIMAVPVLLRLKKVAITKENATVYLSLGLLCTPINLLLLFLGIQQTTAIDASIISIISPILVILGGAYFLKEKVSKNEKIGIALTLCGTLFTMVQPFLEKKSHLGSSFLGNFLVFLGTLVWVYFTLLTKKFHKDKIDPFLLTGVSFFLGYLVMIPLFLYEKGGLIIPFTEINPKAVWGLLFMAVFSSAVAYFAYIYGLTKISASKVGIFTYMQPVFAIPVSILILNEKITIPFMIGAFLITTGVILCEHNVNKTKNV